MSDTPPYNRQQAERQFGDFYQKISSEFCLYCGVKLLKHTRASDHAYPLYAAWTYGVNKVDDSLWVIVDCCICCNSTAARKLHHDIAERRVFILYERGKSSKAVQTMLEELYTRAPMASILYGDLQEALVRSLSKYSTLHSERTNAKEPVERGEFDSLTPSGGKGRCRYCGVEFIKTNQNQMYCTVEHRYAWYDAEAIGRQRVTNG